MPKNKPVPQSEQALQPEEGGCDYILKKTHEYVWLTVENISVYVKRCDEGVSVTLYPKGGEDGDPLTETWATYAEARSEME